LPACRTLQAALEPDGSPLFAWKSLAACRRFEPRKHSRTLALTHPGIPSSPLRDRVDCFNHDRFRGYDTVHIRSGLLPSCLRFAVYVTGHHARLGMRLLARPCRGRHLRRLTSIRFTRRNPHGSGRDALASSGSYPPASGLTPCSHKTNNLGSRRAMRPSQCIDARSRRLNRLYFHRTHCPRASLKWRSTWTHFER